MIRCMATSRQKIPLPHMLPEDIDSAYAVLWPLANPIKKTNARGLRIYRSEVLDLRSMGRGAR